MDVKAIQTEQAQIAVIYEKNAIILQLNERNDTLFAENENLKGVIKNLEEEVARLKSKSVKEK